MATDTNQTIQDSRRAAMSFLDAAKKKAEDRKNRTSTYSRGGGSRGGGSVVDNFLSAGRRNEARAAAAQNGGESGFDLHYRFRDMSDDDFYKGVADGEITQEQIRKAGQEAYENYMLDVWSEMDDNDLKPWPSYEEFIADPAKYGYEEATEFPERLYRYKPGAAQGVINGNKMQGK